MALSDLAVFSKATYDTMQETLNYNVALFNEATRGGLILRAGDMQGDYADRAFWKRITDLVRRRNAYGNAAVSEKVLQMLTETMVKVAAGTPPVRTDPSMFEWIQQNPALGGVLYGQQLAEEALADMVDTSIMALIAAMSGATEIVHDGTAATATQVIFNTAQAKLGDRYERISVWLMHSKPLFDIFGAALANTTALFEFGTTKVVADFLGRPFVISDSPALWLDDGVGVGIDLYYIIGLTAGAALVERNDDFTQNVEEKNGFENIIRSIQSEWSYNLGIKGFAWDKANGGKSPNDAALALTTNWDRIATSHKDLPGVLVKVR